MKRGTRSLKVFEKRQSVKISDCLIKRKLKSAVSSWISFSPIAHVIILLAHVGIWLREFAIAVFEYSRSNPSSVKRYVDVDSGICLTCTVFAKGHNSVQCLTLSFLVITVKRTTTVPNTGIHFDRFQ